MIAVICIFLPSFLLLVVRNRLISSQRDIKKLLVEYAIILLGMTWVSLIALVFMKHSPENLFYRLNNNNGLAQKYLLFQITLSLFVPFAERYFRSKVSFSVVLPQKGAFTFKYWRVIIIVYAVVLVAMNFIRIFDNNFWGDELYDILLVNNSGNLKEMMKDKIANDTMPPFYHIFFYFFCKIFGYKSTVYHFFSLIPYMIVVIFSLTVIYRDFGKETSIIFISLVSLLNNAVHFNIEVRVYSWASCFMLMSFYSLYKVLSTEITKHFVLFGLYSVLSMYTHYYCFLGVAPLYLVLLIVALVSKKNLKKVIILYIGTVLCYMPWLFVFFKDFTKVAAESWIQNNLTIKYCINYLFEGQGSFLFFIITVYFIVVSFFYQSGILQLDFKEIKSIKINLAGFKFTNFSIWIIAGVMGILGTILGGIVISFIFRPLFYPRYMYPVCVFAWLIMAVCVSKCKLKTAYTVAMLCMVFSFLVPQYKYTYTREKSQCERMNMLVDKTKNEISNSDEVFVDTNISHYYRIFPYYFPGVEYKTTTYDALQNIKIDESKICWLFLSGKDMDAKVRENLNKQNVNIVRTVNKGWLGLRDVWVYKITPVDIGKQ